MRSGWRQSGCGDTIMIGPTRPLAVSRRDSYRARINKFLLIASVENGGITAKPGTKKTYLNRFSILTTFNRV